VTTTPITVLVVAYGDPATLEACLSSIGDGFPVVVVDNSSSEETRVVAQRSGATYVDPGENLGFASAVNRGLATLVLPDTDVLLLNPDALVEASAVEVLRGVLLSDPGTACVAPRQHRPGQVTPSPVCWPFPTPSGAWKEALGLGRFGRGWGYVIASVLLVRGEALADVGGFDEGFFLYAEEADWERRATRRGWRVSYCADAVATHVGAATDDQPARREVRFHAGIERYVRKWSGPVGWRSYQTATVLTALRRALVSRGARRRSSLALARRYAKGPYRTALDSGMIPHRRYHVPVFGSPGGDQR
jgi:GT2 family glycosyltransferase